MVQKTTPKELITPAEIAAICKKAGTTDSIDRAIAIEKAVKENVSQDVSDLWLHLLVIGAIYDGGRIQGIREERTKRTNKNE